MATNRFGDEYEPTQELTVVQPQSAREAARNRFGDIPSPITLAQASGYEEKTGPGVPVTPEQVSETAEATAEGLGTGTAELAAGLRYRPVPTLTKLAEGVYASLPGQGKVVEQKYEDVTETDPAVMHQALLLQARPGQPEVLRAMAAGEPIPEYLQPPSDPEELRKAYRALVGQPYESDIERGQRYSGELIGNLAQAALINRMLPGRLPAAAQLADEPMMIGGKMVTPTAKIPGATKTLGLSPWKRMAGEALRTVATDVPFIESAYQHGGTKEAVEELLIGTLITGASGLVRGAKSASELNKLSSTVDDIASRRVGRFIEKASDVAEAAGHNIDDIRVPVSDIVDAAKKEALSPARIGASATGSMVDEMMSFPEGRKFLKELQKATGTTIEGGAAKAATKRAGISSNFLKKWDSAANQMGQQIKALGGSNASLDDLIDMEAHARMASELAEDPIERMVYRQYATEIRDRTMSALSDVGEGGRPALAAEYAALENALDARAKLARAMTGLRQTEWAPRALKRIAPYAAGAVGGTFAARQLLKALGGMAPSP